MTKTYAQIAREIAALQATASKLYAVEVKSAVAKVNELVAKYGLSAGDLAFAAAPGGGRADASAPVAKAAATPTAGGAKYSDGQGRVWGGRGPRPAWLRSAIAAGRSLESFLIAGAADVVAALTRSTSGSAKKAVAKKPPATGIAKYVNPKTGAGWSGRGPRPQWLKDALKKRGSKIEDFLGDKPALVDAAPAAPAPAPAKKASAPVKKVAAKKAVAKKAVAKKTAVKVAAKKAVKAPTKSVTVAPAKKAAAKKAVAKAPAKKVPAKKTAVSSGAPATPAATPVSDASGSIA